MEPQAVPAQVIRHQNYLAAAQGTEAACAYLLTAMEKFQLHPDSVASLACGTLCLVVAGYLASLPQRSRDGRRLTGLFLLLTAIHGSGFLAESVAPPSLLHAYALQVQIGLIALQLPYSLWYAYGYRQDFFPREMRWAVGGSALLMALAWACGPHPFAWFSQLHLLVGLWKFVVLARKTGQVGHPNDESAGRPIAAIWREFRRPSTRESQAQRALAFWSLSSIVLALNAVLSDAGVVYPHAYWTVVHYGLLLTQLIWLMITYLDYTEEPTTFLAKLVSLFLCLTLFLLGILGSLLYGERTQFDPVAALNQPGLRLLAGLIVLGTSFILVAVPFFLRRHWLLPLRQVVEGVTRVNAGDLTNPVPVFVHDELGLLAQSFNQMTNSLRVYATQMEELVSRRTAELVHQKQDLQRTLEDLRTAQMQLVQREKLASLGELTAGIAHEIQNPLNFVTNFSEVSAELVAELAQEQQQSPRDTALEADLLASLQQNLRLIGTHGQRAARIVHGMLAHTRPTTGAYQLTDLNALATEYLRLACHGAEALTSPSPITITTDFAPNLPEVRLLPSEIGRVLVGICANAFYAVRRQAAVPGASYCPALHVSTRCNGAQVELRVRDNGTGMPAAVQAKVFQPFFTTKPTGEGVGLGLSLAYTIVTQGHEGTLMLSSCEGEGTEVVIALPI